MPSKSLTNAETAELRRSLDNALPVLRNCGRDIRDHDWPVDDLCDVVQALHEVEISTPDQLSILHDALDYLADEYDEASATDKVQERAEELQLSTYNRALLTLGRHVMAERKKRLGSNRLN